MIADVTLTKDYVFNNTLTASIKMVGSVEFPLPLTICILVRFDVLGDQPASLVWPLHETWKAALLRPLLASGLLQGMHH